MGETFSLPVYMRTSAEEGQDMWRKLFCQDLLPSQDVLAPHLGRC